MPAIKLEESSNDNCVEVFTTSRGHTCKNVADTTITTANKPQHESTSWLRKNSSGIRNTERTDLDAPLIHASQIDETPYDFLYTNQRHYSTISPPSPSLPQSVPQSILSNMLKTSNIMNANLDRRYSSDCQVEHKMNVITPPPVPARLNKSPALPERKNVQKMGYNDNVEPGKGDRSFSNSSNGIGRRLSTESAFSTIPSGGGDGDNSQQIVKLPPPPQSTHSKRSKTKPALASDNVTDAADKRTVPNTTSSASALLDTCTQQQRKSLINNEGSYFKFPKVCPSSSGSSYNGGDDEMNVYSQARRKSGKKIPPPLRTCPNLEDSLDDTPSTFGELSNAVERLHGSTLSCSDGGVSQTSSPSYLVRSLESPLLPTIKNHHSTNKHAKRKFTAVEKLLFANNEYAVGYAKDEKCVSPTDLTKSQSTPAVLQTVVDYQLGSNLPSYRHKVIKNEKRNSCYVSRGHLKFQFAQIVINIIVLLAVAGTLAWYFRAFPVTTTVKYINHTIIMQNMSQRPIFYYAEPNEIFYCQPLSTKFCLVNHVPYNYTVLPNQMLGSQREADEILNSYQAISKVRCYQLAPLFLCSLYLPKCDENMASIHPCRNLCHETYRRCGIFFKIFGLRLAEHIDCDNFPDSQFPDDCIGNQEVLDHQKQESITVCHDGFQCDHTRCIPVDWRCDGHIDCQDQEDESNCTQCPGQLHCGHGKCIATSHICDGVLNCPGGQDERNCVRLNNQMGDIGTGYVEVFVAKDKAFQTACIHSWDQQNSPTVMCQLLGYKYMNHTTLENRSVNTSIQYIQYNKETVDDNKLRLFHELKNCVNHNNSHHPIVNARCSTYECGIRKQSIGLPIARIIGGQASNPGDWPFLAAILGGPKEIFYCAGVLISDQWVLSAAHCVGDFNLSHPPVDWTIQLGITRRSSHSYFGQKLKVQRVIPHPKYNQNVIHDNDIALFQLSEKVRFHDHLLPVCMPSATTVLESSSNCTVIGWGRRSESDDYERTVFEVRVPIVNRSVCNAWLRNQNMDITQSMICAGYEEGGKDACQGDSGGPLLCQSVNERDRWFVAGIVSWGMKCAHPYLPGIYANVPYFLGWINEQMDKFSNNR